MYGIMAGLGGLLGVAAMLLIREPERGRYLDEAAKQKEKEKKEKAALEAAQSNKNPLRAFVDNLAYVFTLPCARNTFMASALRNFGGIIVSSFIPVFFGRNFPAFKAEFALFNAMAQVVFGLTASLGSGIISDKFEKKSLLTKAMVCISGCAIAPILLCTATLQTSSFWLSMVCFMFSVLVQGTYSGPAITMI